MTEREALKLTLAALKQIDEAMPFPVAKLAIMKAEEVLEQPAPVLTGIDCSCGRKWRVVNNTLTASEQPEQEPVACVQDLDEVKRKHLVYKKGMDWKDPLYTTPPQRTWVGLTPQERDEINQKVFGIVPHYVAFHHAIEAKLKEKNT